MDRRAIECLKERYLSKMKETPELYLGIELEFPIVNLAGGATDISLAKKLLSYLSDRLNVTILKRDEDGTPIQLYDHQTGDQLLFEVSYNILEMAFGKAKTVGEVERRFQTYLTIIQEFLAPQQHALQGEGLHPGWQVNDNRPIATAHYQMLTAYLKLADAYPKKQFHSFNDYGGFICGSQVQLDVSPTNYLEVINAFNQIEGIKAHLFANSYFSDGAWQTSIARDFFWERSMHGFFSENVGLYPKPFASEEEFLEYLSRSSFFYVLREGQYYYFEPIQVKDYLQRETIESFDLMGNRKLIQPQATDFDYHRSYHYQTLTTRGTVEFRSVCCQPFDRTFAPAAFHLGLLSNWDKFIELLATCSSPEFLELEWDGLRKTITQSQLTPNQQDQLEKASKALLACAKEGLLKRGHGEEVYLSCL
ncbi:gamma-glutamylcysteine synthetase [Streptococcus cuniculipharyngis]|uniref:glutamate--cysteine ligase n=1 Tax=Streptococcus cuniculipharyngis TaxID=1562651 RepID=A0A5C5SC52_9STRE|nr:gamma-glutamylcysteine synthetase [Streptococcus cuniculipharyngis]TWS97202.1 gamma-glutamylcysteine synthetase [Streptococcus cuniculipharyngis]